MALLFSIFLFNGLHGQDIDLSKIAAADMRSNLRPVFSILSSHHEMPFSASFYNSDRKVIISSNLAHGFQIFNAKERGLYLPSFWGGFVTSPNLSLFLQLSNGSYQKENISTFGPVINFIWGEEAKENVINVSINHLRGPDDFRAKDIALSLAKKKNINSLVLYYGLEAHYVNTVIDVKSTGYKNTINETLYHLRTGLYKSIRGVDLGIEMSISREMVIGKINITKII